MFVALRLARSFLLYALMGTKNGSWENILIRLMLSLVPDKGWVSYLLRACNMFLMLHLQGKVESCETKTRKTTNGKFRNLVQTAMEYRRRRSVFSADARELIVSAESSWVGAHPFWNLLIAVVFSAKFTIPMSSEAHARIVVFLGLVLTLRVAIPVTQAITDATQDFMRVHHAHDPTGSGGIYVARFLR